MSKKKGSYLNYTGYNHTSNAYKLNNSYAEQLPEHKPKKKKYVKKKKLVRYINAIDRGIYVTKEFYITAAVIFIAAICLLMTNALVVNKKNSVESLRAELKTLQEANQSAKVELSKSYDESEIERMATLMGMGKPKPYQVVHIYVPKESYALISTYTASSEADKLSWLKDIKKEISSLFIKD